MVAAWDRSSRLVPRVIRSPSSLPSGRSFPPTGRGSSGQQETAKHRPGRESPWRVAAPVVGEAPERAPAGPPAVSVWPVAPKPFRVCGKDTCSAGEAIGSQERPAEEPAHGSRQGILAHLTPLERCRGPQDLAAGLRSPDRGPWNPLANRPRKGWPAGNLSVQVAGHISYGNGGIAGEMARPDRRGPSHPRRRRGTPMEFGGACPFWARHHCELSTTWFSGGYERQVALRFLTSRGSSEDGVSPIHRSCAYVVGLAQDPPRQPGA